MAVHGVNGHWYEAKSLWPECAKRVESTPSLLGISKNPHGGFTSKVTRELARAFNKLQSGLQLKGKTALNSGPRIEFDCNDVLLMADASWMEPNWKAVANAKNRSVTIGLLIYDLIPLVNPELFPSELVARFRSWFERAILTADFIVCISQAVASSVVNELRKHDIERSLAAKIYWFPLGANLEKSKRVGPLSTDVQSWFATDRTENPCLVVGTLEPRKNHGLILDAFERLWKDNSPLSLCLLGRVGWNCRSLLDRIQNHPEFGRRLFLNTDASDDDVRYAYERARAVIMASINEGYGLPIVEGLGYRQMVLASDIAVHREVGLDQVHYFSIDNGAEPLRHMLQGIEQNNLPCLLGEYGVATKNVISWKESYDVLCETILEATCESDSSLFQVKRAA